MERVFREQYPGESLDHFAERAVTTTPLERSKFGQDIDRFVRFLHSQSFRSPHSVKEVLKSGSLGKGTAVRGLADIDLVVYVNGLSGIEDLQRTRGVLLEDLESKVKSFLGISPKNFTPYSLSFEWQGNKVDILPAFDVISQYTSPARIYEAMIEFGSVKKAAQQFSASLAPLQLQFVKPAPEHVKRVIRLVKLWNEENDVGLRSYSIELLTIYVWRRSGEGNPGTNYLFREVMRELANCGSLRVAFGDNYDSDMYTGFMEGPYIMDPASPYMNTLHGVHANYVSECAENTLAGHLFCKPENRENLSFKSTSEQDTGGYSCRIL